ncbi:hypothetical protein D3C78_1746530 [compost metagenome]
MDVHRTARLVLHRLGQEGGIHPVAHRRLTHGALEQEHLVGQVHRVGVGEVDFQLRRAGFVDQRVHVQLHRIAVVVHQVKDRIEFVDRIDRIRLPRRFRAP